MRTRKPHKYIVAFSDVSANTAEKYNAGAKAPMDIVRFLEDDGWELLNFPYIELPPKKRFIKFPFYVLRLLTKIRRGNEFMMIHPYFTWQATVMDLLFRLKPLFRKVGAKLHCYVVDIMCVRFMKDTPDLEMKVLNTFDSIIVHSPKMADYVRDNGVESKTAILGLLDYSVKVPNTMERSLSHDICFAGNLQKSWFLHTFDETKFPKAKFLLYGLGMTEDLDKPCFTYKGKFSPEDLSGIEGSWGLIWDGDSCNGLVGSLGDYLKLNSPHKASMCLCAGLPLIAPEGSFTAELVKKEGMGIVVRSIEDVDSAIDAITPEEYAAMLENVHNHADRLTHGLNLADALKALE